MGNQKITWCTECGDSLTRDNYCTLCLVEEVAQLKREKAELESDHNALIERVKAHNEKMMVMINRRFNVPVKNSSGELSTSHKQLMKHYLISLDAAEERS